MAKAPIPLPIVIEEEKKEDCPKCPPVGAPAWMATFADMATLLMAFFVLILSFAEFNQPKFKMIAGSLKNAFGIQRIVPITEQPKGTTVLELNFSPSPDMSALEEIKQDTTDTEKPEPKTKDGESDGEGDEAGNDPTPEQKELAEALANALESGAVKVEMNDDGQIVMKFEQTESAENEMSGASQEQSSGQDANTAPAPNETATGTDTGGAPKQSDTDTNPSMAQTEMAQNDRGDSSNSSATSDPAEQQQDNMSDRDKAKAITDQLQDAAQALAKAHAQTGQNTDDVLMAGLTESLQTLADIARDAQKRAEEAQSQSQADNANTVQPNSGGGAGTGTGNGDGDAAKERQLELKEAELSVALREEIGQGLVEVERRNGKVFVTVGAGGAFASGSADVTQQARDIVSRISFSSMGEAAEIKVTGHTDDVPISGEFRDNWDLAAARAAAVVREIEQSGLLPATRMEAISKGETQPIADNTTEEGRAKNRRIEIEITYGE